MDFFDKHVGKFLLVVDYYESKSKRFELAAFSNLALLLEYFDYWFRNSKVVKLDQNNFWNDGDDVQSNDDIDLVIYTGHYTHVHNPFYLYLFGRLPLEFFH
jgi:hypothetical protein